jgi:hypothetical protein
MFLEHVTDIGLSLCSYKFAAYILNSLSKAYAINP